MHNHNQSEKKAENSSLLPANLVDCDKKLNKNNSFVKDFVKAATLISEKNEKKEKSGKKKDKKSKKSKLKSCLSNKNMDIDQIDLVERLKTSNNSADKSYDTKKKDLLNLMISNFKSTYENIKKKIDLDKTPENASLKNENYDRNCENFEILENLKSPELQISPINSPKSPKTPKSAMKMKKIPSIENLTEVKNKSRSNIKKRNKKMVKNSRKNLNEVKFDFEKSFDEKLLLDEKEKISKKNFSQSIEK